MCDYASLNKSVFPIRKNKTCVAMMTILIGFIIANAYKYHC